MSYLDIVKLRKKNSEFLGVVVGVRQKIWTESESKKSTPQGTNLCPALNTCRISINTLCNEANQSKYSSNVHMFPIKLFPYLNPCPPIISA